MGLTTGVIGWLVLKPIFSTIRSLADLPQTDSLNLRTIVGGLVALGLLMIGIVVILGGLFAGLMEVRGRMLALKNPPQPDRKFQKLAPSAWSTVIDSIGKLKGAALLLVVGCIPLLAAAWIGKTAVEVPGSAAVATTVAPSDAEKAPSVPTSPSTDTQSPSDDTEALPNSG
jgi:uncharacterized membrane protein SirB2